MPCIFKCFPRASSTEVIFGLPSFLVVGEGFRVSWPERATSLNPRPLCLYRCCLAHSSDLWLKFARFAIRRPKRASHQTLYLNASRLAVYGFFSLEGPPSSPISVWLLSSFLPFSLAGCFLCGACLSGSSNHVGLFCYSFLHFSFVALSLVALLVGYLLSSLRCC